MGSSTSGRSATVDGNRPADGRLATPTGLSGTAALQQSVADPIGAARQARERRGLLTPPTCHADTIQFGAGGETLSVWTGKQRDRFPRSDSHRNAGCDRPHGNAECGVGCNSHITQGGVMRAPPLLALLA